MPPSALALSPTDRATLDAKVEFLRQPASYPDATQHVQAVETHMAWVFLTDTQAYKIKKPIRSGVLDLTTPSARRRSSVLEVQLNRRLAGSVYQGVVRLAQREGTLAIGGGGTAVDWLIKMHRLPADRMVDAMALNQSLRPAHLRKTAARLARFYQSLPPALGDPSAYREGLRSTIAANARTLRLSPYNLPPAQIDSVSRILSAFVDDAQALLEARVLDGHVVEGHGDLRPEHVCLCPDPIIFDCLEFSRALRVLDAADEIAFLAMECERLGVRFATSTLFDTYGRAMHDSVPLRLVRFYQAHRALERARLAVRHTRTGQTPPKAHAWGAQALAYLDHAERLLEEHA